MAYYATITELIDSIKDREISYRNLHTNVYIREDGEIIKIPYKSLTREYMPYFSDTLVPAAFSDAELVRYRYKPKSLSYDLYGTTEIWGALLEVNNLYSIIDFNLEKTIQVFEPREFKRLLNEVMILEGLLK